ncbi:hypothetical protein BJX66DRAFT_329712 [Aspergillus keveii]|uniref:Fe2OG dioxygenase domain-containing protein n=1 Tax=Aspergillus keveii TaxID=714993 RepID=A0ABR4FNH0_9EURO
MRTVKTHFGELHVQEGIVPVDFTNIPIIDLSNLDSPDLASRQPHGIPPEKVTAMHEAAQAFFALPHEQKMEYYLGKSNVSAPSQHAHFWPDDDVLPGLQATYLEYFRECVTLSRKLLRIFALSLGLDEGYFDKFVTYPGCMSRILHYPPQPVPGEERVGIEAHTDFECFTILSQDSVPALQVLNSSNQWVTATPIPDTLVVNVGDFMSFWTGGKFRLIVHRVTNLTGENRYSVPFFFGVNYDATVEVLPSCVAEDGKGERRSVKAGQYVRDRLSKSYIGFGEAETKPEP